MYESLVALTQLPAPTAAELAAFKAHCRVDASDSTEDANLSLYFLAARQAIASRLKQTLTTTQYILTRDLLPIGSMNGPTSSVGMNVFLNTSVYPYTLDSVFKLPHAPLISVDQVEYLDTSSTWQTLDPSFYAVVPGFPGRIAPAYGQIWPFTLPQIGAVKIKFTSGYGATTTSVALSGGTTTTTTSYSSFGLPAPIVTVTTAPTVSADQAGTTTTWNIPFSVQAATMLWGGSLYRNREAVTDGVLSEMPMGVQALLDSQFKGFYR